MSVTLSLKRELYNNYPTWRPFVAQMMSSLTMRQIGAERLTRAVTKCDLIHPPAL